MDYLVWEAVAAGNACKLDAIENVEPQSALMQGTPLARSFPRDAQLRMSARHKKSTGLTDDLSNYDKIKVCSGALVEFLKERRLKNVEYLPVRVLDHKGKPVSTRYAIVHPVVLQDALDVKASRPSYSALAPDEIDEVERLVLDKARLDPEVRIFRLAAFFFPVLIEKGLAQELQGEGFTGPYFQELDEYGQ